MIIGKEFKGSKIIDVTSQSYIGFTQDNTGVYSVVQHECIMDKPINRGLSGTSNKITLYEHGVEMGSHKKRLTDVKPRIHSK